MSLFLSYCFSFWTRPDLVLAMFYYNAAVRRVLETLICKETTVMENIFRKVFSCWKWTQVMASFYQFSEHLFMVASKHLTETHSFEW